MRIRSFQVFQVLFVLLFVPLVVAAQSVRQVPLARSTPFPATPPTSANASLGPELDSAVLSGDADDQTVIKPDPVSQ
jgi:hypothetical protein